MHFKPTQSVLQSWYQLGSVYSSQCKNQMEFMNKLKDVAADCSFSNKEEVIKFLFLMLEKINQTKIHGFNKQQKHGPKRSKSKHHNNHSQSHLRSGSHGGRYPKCCSSHQPKQCPAFGKECYRCHKINHFSKLFRNSNPLVVVA